MALKEECIPIGQMQGNLAIVAFFPANLLCIDPVKNEIDSPTTCDPAVFLDMAAVWRIFLELLIGIVNLFLCCFDLSVFLGKGHSIRVLRCIFKRIQATVLGVKF